MYFEKQIVKCPNCGDKAALTPWKPPRGIEQRFREYKCSNQVCRCQFYMCGIYHTDQRKPSDVNRGLLSVIE